MNKQVMPFERVKVDLCSFCEHSYITPCHGKEQECPNRRFIEGGGVLKAQRDPVAVADKPKKKGKAPAPRKVREVRIMDDVEAPACDCCKTSAWMVDGDGAGSYWLTCTDPDGRGCDERRELPDNVRVVE